LKVVFLQVLNPDTVRYFKEKLQGHELVFPQAEDVAKLAQAANRADVLVGYRLPKEVLDAAPKLKAFITGAAGVDKSVRENLKARPEVQVGNSHANSLDVAEHAMALAMAAAKLVARGDRELRKGDWTLRYDDVPGTLLTGKTAVLVGYGAIGRALAELLKGFKMRFVGVRSSRKTRGVDALGVQMVGPDDLDMALKSADFVFVLAPLTPLTKGMIGAPQFAALKRSAVLVNVSRGPVVDEDALFDALKSQRIAAAGIDVWYVYPKGGADVKKTAPGNQPFKELSNLVMSPHRASYTERMHREQWDDVVESIQRLARGESVKYKVDLAAGY
jgi:phosphoglycerate dehydrogenase-like enzyme